MQRNLGLTIFSALTSLLMMKLRFRASEVPIGNEITVLLSSESALVIRLRIKPIGLIAKMMLTFWKIFTT